MGLEVDEPWQEHEVLFDFDLSATLESGQSFQWEKGSAGYRGWIGGAPVQVRQQGRCLIWKPGPDLKRGAVPRYFRLDFDPTEVRAAFLSRDPFLKRAVEFAPGLHLLNQDPWECLAGFILSSTKQIVHIKQIWARLSEQYGDCVVWDGIVHHRFPRPEILAKLDEEALRRCKMGFRARYLSAAARAVASGRIHLGQVAGFSTGEARRYLMRLAGVGAKIADCVLLFAYGRHDAFPRDVWIERVLREVYFRRRHPSARQLDRFVSVHFGEHAGYAQQYLFHYVRHHPLSLDCASGGVCK